MDNQPTPPLTAFDYVARGWPVLPLYHVEPGGRCSCDNRVCKSPGKHLRTAYGQKDATNGPNVLGRWWAKWPGANVGLVTGPASGFWVLGPDGTDGLADLDRLAKVADYWAAAARSLAVPADSVAVPGVALLGAGVGRSRAAAVKKGYAKPPCVWVAVIAPPGATKSPPLRSAAAPLAWAEARWIETHREAVILFDTEMDRHAARVKEWKAGGCDGEPPLKPTRPTLR